MLIKYAVPGIPLIKYAVPGILAGFNKQWRDAVILPPFAANRATIYNRAENVT